jgi:thioredoxin-dependent peroxiredoxin
MLAIGTVAPDIDAEASSGRFRLSDHAGHLCTVVYFYPKSFTPGCTREAATFRDNYQELLLVGAALVGVSTDDRETQCKFAESMQATFPIVSDHDGAIASAYRVRWPLVGLAKRVTYVLDPARVVLAAFHHELQIGKHRDDVLRFVDELHRQRGAAPDTTARS